MENIDLKLNSTQLLKIIDNSWDNILILDKSSKVEYINNSFLMLLGYPKEKVLGSPFELFLDSKSQDEFEKLLSKVDSSEVQSFIKVKAKSKDGHDLFLHVAMFKIFESDLVALNAKTISEPVLASTKKVSTTPNTQAKNAKKDEDILDKTFGWLNGANKAFGSMFGSDKEKPKSKPSAGKATKKHTPSPSLLLPLVVDEMSRDDLREDVKGDIETFQSLGYVEYPKEDLIAAKEWHSWQVSKMLKLYKMGDRIFIPEKDSIFPEAIKELTRHTLEQVIQNMITNFKTRANVHAKKEILSKDAKWSAMEVGCLLYFLLE